MGLMTGRLKKFAVEIDTELGLLRIYRELQGNAHALDFGLTLGDIIDAGESLSDVYQADPREASKLGLAYPGPKVLNAWRRSSRTMIQQMKATHPAEVAEYVSTLDSKGQRLIASM